MVNRNWLKDVNVTEVVLYTSSIRCSGLMRSQQPRLSDYLNGIQDDYLVVLDAAVDPLYLPLGTRPVRVQLAQFRRDSIILALPNQARAGQERTVGALALVMPRDRHEVNLEAYPFAIRGTIHVAPEIELREHLQNSFTHFMPVTEASITYIPNRQRDFQAPVILVNKATLQVLLVREASASQWAAATQPEIRHAAFSTREAMATLLKSSLFAGINPIELDGMVGDLIRKTLIDAKDCLPSSTIFEQDSMGDTMYIIESGAVEIQHRASPQDLPQLLATLEPGAIFGEMAILGDQRRTAAAIASGPTRLLAIQEGGLKSLLTAFPTVAGQLLRLIAERRGILESLPGASKTSR